MLELREGLGRLLQQRRSGVVAALLAAAGRLRAGQSDACRALARGLTSTSSTAAAAGAKVCLAQKLVLVPALSRSCPAGGSKRTCFCTPVLHALWHVRPLLPGLTVLMEADSPATDAGLGAGAADA